MKIRDAMTTEVQLCTPDDTLRDAAEASGVQPTALERDDVAGGHPTVTGDPAGTDGRAIASATDPDDATELALPEDNGRRDESLRLIPEHREAPDWEQLAGLATDATTALAAGRCDCAASVATGKASGL